MAAATVVDTVTDYIEETIENCRSNSQSGIESRLFDGTVQLATCLLAISTLISLQELSTHQESNFLDLFSTLSSVYVLFEDRLNSVAQGGSHLVSLHGGQRGRPRISIDLTQVESLLDLGLSLSDIANFLGISRVTIWRRLSSANLCVTRFSDINDSTLDSVLASITRNSPNIGIAMLTGHLRASNIYVSRERIRNSLVRLSPLNVLMRNLTTASRRRYSVPGPNSLWHIDGLHCLIRWRLVTHGGVDGFSRMIVYMHCSTNNRASTVLGLFLDAVHQYGWPSRVRSDQGGENIDVARVIISRRGTGRRSHIAGASVHNQRIERTWRDTFSNVCHLFYGLFYELENLGFLDPLDERDLFCLHYVFVPRINCQLQQFVQAWNRHPLRTEGNSSPLLLWTVGMQEAVCNPTHPDHTTVLDGLTSFGVDPLGPSSNPFDQGSVEIPETNVDLSAAQMHTIRTQFYPLAPSSSYGIDIYIGLRYVIHNLI